MTATPCASCGMAPAPYSVPGDARHYCDEKCHWTRKEAAFEREWANFARGMRRIYDTRRATGQDKPGTQCPKCGGGNTIAKGHQRGYPRIYCKDCQKRFQIMPEREKRGYTANQVLW